MLSIGYDFMELRMNRKVKELFFTLLFYKKSNGLFIFDFETSVIWV